MHKIYSIEPQVRENVQTLHAHQEFNICLIDVQHEMNNKNHPSVVQRKLKNSVRKE